MSVLNIRRHGMLAGAGLLALLCAFPAHAESPREQWHQQLSTSYAVLAESSAALQTQISEHCEADPAATTKPLQNAWLSAFLAWQRVRYIDFGPIEQNSMAWQFQFWPDSKNLIARQVDSWVKDSRPATTQALAGESVALKGFPAMEYLLFETGAESLSPKACEVLAAISGQNSSNAATLLDQWGVFKPHYLQGEQYQTTTISAVMHGLEIVRDARLGAPMGLQGKKRRNLYLADAWRSEQSLAAIQATLQGVKSDFLPGFAVVMADAGQQPLLAEFEAALDASLTRLDQLPTNMSESLKNDEDYRGLQLLFVDIDRLARLLNGPIASALGIVKGFNSSDGD